MRLLLVVALAGVLATAAWGANGDPKAQHTAAGTVAAQKGLLQRGDFPKGWKGTVAKPAGASTLCKDVRPNLSDLTEVGYATARDYSFGQTMNATQRVRVFRNEAQAKRAWSRTVTIGLVSCLAKQLEAASSKKSKVTVTGQFRLPVPKAAADADGFRVVAHAVTPDDKFNVYADVVVLRQGATITTMTFTGFLYPFDSGLEARLVRTVGQRIGGKSAVA